MELILFRMLAGVYVVEVSLPSSGKGQLRDCGEEAVLARTWQSPWLDCVCVPVFHGG